jgi:amino acid transporter
MSLGVALAIFNTMIAVALIAGRQLYCTGRDQFWGGGLNQFLARLHSRTGAPWTATLTMGAISLVFCGLDQQLLVLILGNGNVILYAGLCAAALVGRQSGRTRAAAYRLPLYPWPPVLALLALGAVGWFDLHDPAGAEGLGVSLAVAAAGLAYHRGFLQGRPRWRLGASLQAAAAPVSPEA